MFSQRGHRNGMPRRLCFSALLLLGCLAAISACGSVPVEIPTDHDTFDGIGPLVTGSALAGDAARLRVLVIHGMGTNGPSDFDPFISSLATRLGLVQLPPSHPSEPEAVSCGSTASPSRPVLAHPAPKFVDNDAVPKEAQARLYTYDFVQPGGSSLALSVSYLYWAPLTEAVKCAALAETDAPRRQWFADNAKQFIDGKLGDVVLYAGRYRDEIMRPSVQAALCLLIEGSPRQNGKICRGGDSKLPTVLISHSLGGYMLMDAIDEELRRDRRDGSLNRETAAFKILQNTHFIYMMANQLAFLDLTELDKYPFLADHAQVGEAMRKSLFARGRPGRLMGRFSRAWSAIKLRPRTPASLDVVAPASPSYPARQLVAFSDPNDILSWLVQGRNVEDPSVHLTNVYLSNNEFSIPGLFSDPVTAHSGYFANNAVRDLIVCGMNKGKVRSCAATSNP
jgi:hypothetical protein